MAQIGHGKLADAVQIIHIAAGGKAAVVGLYGLFGQKVLRNVVDVVAVVEGLALGVVRVSRPTGVTRFEAFGTQLGRLGQGGYLHPRVVVVKLAVHLLTLRGPQIADRVAQRRLTAMAYMQRAGGVGGDKLHHHLLAGFLLVAVAVALRQHLADHLLLRLGFQPKVNKPRPGNLYRCHPVRKLLIFQELLAQLFSYCTRVLLQGLGQLHGRRTGKVPMLRDFRRLQRGPRPGAWAQYFQFAGQRGQ